MSCQESKIAIVEKARITREYIAGNISRKEAARQSGVHHDVITDWARIYRREGALGLEPEEKNRAIVLSKKSKRSWNIYQEDIASTASAKNTQFAQEHNSDPG